MNQFSKNLKQINDNISLWLTTMLIKIFWNVTPIVYSEFWKKIFAWISFKWQPLYFLKTELYLLMDQYRVTYIKQ